LVFIIQTAGKKENINTGIMYLPFEKIILEILDIRNSDIIPKINAVRFGVIIREVIQKIPRKIG